MPIPASLSSAIDYWNWFGSRDTGVLSTILICLFAAGFVQIGKASNQLRLLLGIASVAAVIKLGSLTAYYYVIHLLLFVVVRTRLRSDAEQGTASAERWRWAIVALFVSMTFVLVARVIANIGANSFSFIDCINLWALIRIFSFLWDYGTGQIKRLDGVPYFSWVSFPFTLGGPFISYPTYLKHLENPCPERKIEWRKLAWSVSKVVLSVYLLDVAYRWRYGPEAGIQDFDRLKKYVAFFLFIPWGMYFRFSGHLSAMEALSPAWGIPLPKSFDRPFFRSNIMEFWLNWSTTVTTFFRNHFMFNRWGFRKMNMYLNVVISFVICGLFHFVNEYWVAWGLLQGVGYCVFLLYRRHVAPLLPRNIGAPGKILGGLMTYVFISFSFELPLVLLNMFKAFIANLLH